MANREFCKDDDDFEERYGHIQDDFDRPPSREGSSYKRRRQPPEPDNTLIEYSDSHANIFHDRYIDLLSELATVALENPKLLEDLSTGRMTQYTSLEERA